MADMATKAALKDLTDADLLRIVANPKVGREWAKIAKVNYAELKRGNPKPMRSVRIAIMKRPGGFAHALAHGWELLMNPDDVDDPDLDPLVLHAHMAGYQLGPTGGRAMLYALADDNHLADAAAVRDRLEELLEAAEQGSHFEPPDDEDSQEAPAADADAESDESDEDEDDEVDEVDLDDLQERADALLGQAPALVTQLRAAADAIEQGSPAATLGESPDNWSDAAQSVLDDAVAAGIEDHLTLSAVLDHLRALSEARAQHESERRSNAELALQMIDMLRKAGKPEKIADQLALHGFASLEEVEEAAGIQPAPRPATEDPEPDTAAAESDQPPADDAAEPAGSDDEETLPAPADQEDKAEAAQGSSADDSMTTPVQAVEVATATAPATEPPAPVVTPPAADGAATPNVATPPTEPTAEQSSPSVDEAPSTPAPEKPAENIPVLDEWPWDEGDPPAIGRLLLEGREALAYYLARAAAETQARQQLLLFACATANCSPSAIEMSLLPSDADIRAFDTNESLLLLAAALRAGLRLGYAPVGLQSLLDAADAALPDSSLRDVLHAAAAAVQRGHGRRQPPSGPSAEEMAGRWAELGAAAAKHLERLPDKTLKFQRGSKVLRHLCREGQPLAQALSRAAALTAQGISSASDPEWAQIEDFVDQLRDPGDRERLLAAAEAAVSTPQQRTRRPIDGPVKIQLDDLLREAGDLLSRLLTVRRAILTAGDLKDMAVTDDLERALAQAPSSPAVHSVGDAAVANLVGWLRADDVDPAAPSVDDVLQAALLELFEISRDDQGRALREPTPAEVSVLLEPRDPDQVVSGYLARGNIAAARDFIAARGLEDAGYEDRILKANKTAKTNLDKAYGEAEEGVARLRAVYNDDLARDLGERIRQIMETPRKDRLDLAIEKLQAISEEAEKAMATERDRLKAEVESLDCDEASKARVLQRIEERDEPLAVHFLSVLRGGGVLQEVEAPSGDDFSEFVPRVVDVAAAAQAAGEDAVAAVREALQATSAPTHRFLRDGLVAWQNLKTRRRSGEDFKRSLGDVLRMVGLTPKAHGWYRGEVSRTTAGGFATIRVGASPVDRSYVPQFGSQALGEYDITLVWDPASPSRLMDFIGEGNRNQANIIVYFGTLSLADRRHLRTLTRTTAGGKGFSPIVIDEAVIGWLSHLTEPGWRFTQRITLPFTTLNPYQPNAAGEVPEEVFVGRNDERARIENPTGSMFVYGGRQLGKSALLKRVEHLYTDLRPDESGVVAGKAAEYIDLKAAGIGEAHQPAQLWPLLGERLHSAGILSGKSAPRSARDVTAGILGWLNAEDSNRLLLLLDEADNFLTADSKPREGDLGGFPVLNALKNVMEQSHRRFKVVFAGLHQVQRFFDASNTPVAHGGDAIPIGPLRTHDASDLVVSPLGALGYRFENPELVWRLLLVTNYQASLVQIVCEALVRHLQKRPIPEKGGRMVITAEDVRDVCADPKVSDSIAQRFRWTIHLDSRYRVIALVVAFNSIGAPPGVRFSVDELREWCEVWWPDGFSPDELSRNEFERYLVEMKGLGILQDPEPEMWALRSPNIIQMLGTRDRLEKELAEAQTHLERPLEYNPTMARQIMGDSEGPAAPRSPLTDAELTALLKDSATAQVVFGSPALGIERVVEVIQRQAVRETLNPAIVVDSLQSPELKRVGVGGKRVHVIVDLTKAKPDGTLAHFCRQVAARKSVTATVVIGPAWLDSLETLGEVTVHKLRRWSTAGLRAWYNSPFDSPADRASLHRVTSGWPKLIEEVMADFALKGRSPKEALERLAAELATPERAKQMLADAAIDPQIAKAWVNSILVIDGEQVPASVEDVTEILGLDGAELLGRLESLDVADQEGDNWVLDRVILGAAVTLYKGGK